MISAQQTTDPSLHVKTRAKKMPRIVHFDADQDTGIVKIECYDRETGEACPANLYSLHCSHCEAAIKRLLANAKRVDAIEGAAEPIERVKSVQQYAQKKLDETEQPNLKGIQK